MISPLLDEHRAAKAALGEFAGCLLPESFSDFKSEWRAARDTVALFDTNWHAVTTLSGPDRVRYLNAIVTNNIQSVAEGHGTVALLLNAQGHILAEFEVYALKDRLILLSHGSVRKQTHATLDKYIIMDDVEMKDVTDRMGTIAIEGPRASTVISQATGLALDGFPEFASREVKVDWVPCRVIRRSHFGGVGAEILANREHLGRLWRTLHGSVYALGGAAIGMKALNALRLEAGIPWFPLDFNDGVIPHEAALENTHISFSKGCYTGQEIVERVRSRGHVNRRRVGLSFSTTIAPIPGTKLRANGAESGHVTSAAFSPAAGTAIGMGYLKRDQIEPGTVVEFDGGTATVGAPGAREPQPETEGQ
ncbi:MAG TPA: glycine cleavage T C-terminal barrel domain-containing protein [Candidatus Acidoferrum sp.]|nr:glycine cleavage T C-terminal barrel domain-containing protein [Candidatus Acidoferrum sp.]